MKATISLDASDLLKIARLVHETPHFIGQEYGVRYISDGLVLFISVIEDSNFGYCVENVEAWFSDEYSQAFELIIPSDISTQIENVL